MAVAAQAAMAMAATPKQLINGCRSEALTLDVVGDVGLEPGAAVVAVDAAGDDEPGLAAACNGDGSHGRGGQEQRDDEATTKLRHGGPRPILFCLFSFG